jgi:hypothetical protein
MARLVLSAGMVALHQGAAAAVVIPQVLLRGQAEKVVALAAVELVASSKFQRRTEAFL